MHKLLVAILWTGLPAISAALLYTFFDKDGDKTKQAFRKEQDKVGKIRGYILGKKLALAFAAILIFSLAVMLIFSWLGLPVKAFYAVCGAAVGVIGGVGIALIRSGIK